MTGTIIGRIAVKVMPDTSDFRAAAQRDLDRIEKQLSELNVDIKLKTAGLGRQAAQAQRDIERALKDVTVAVSLDNESSVRAAVGRVQRELDKIDETQLSVDLDRGSLTAAKELLTEQLAKVAKIELKVDPTSVRSLERALDQIDREMDKIGEIDLDVNLNEADLTAARELMEEQLQKQITVKLATDNADYRRVRQEIASILDGIRVKPELDTAQMAAGYRRIETYVEQINDLRAQITPELNDRQRREVERKIADLRDKIDKVRSEIEVEVSEPSWLSAVARLAVLTRDRVVSLIPLVDSKAAVAAGTALTAISGVRVIGDLLNRLWDAFSNLDRMAPKIASLALAVAGLGATGIASASSLASLSASLASIAPAALTLPGILGGLALGVGATVVAFKDFNRVLPEVKAQLSTLADQMSGDFWSAANKPIRTLVDTLLPQFAAGMRQVSTELGGFFGQLATALTDVFAGALRSMFADLSASITIASQATGDLASIIKILGETGAGYLPRLARWFVDITDSFEAWLSAAAGDGRLQAWIDTAITAFTDLGRVVLHLGRILAGIAQAATAAGGSTLATLADGLAAVADTVNSASFQSSLVGVFAAAHQAIDNITSQAGPALTRFFTSLAGTLQTVLPVAGQAIGTLLSSIADALASPAFQGGLVKLFEGIGAAVQALAPAFGPVAAALGAIGGLLGTFLTALAPNVATVFTLLANAVTALAPVLGQVVTILGQGLAAALQQVAPLFARLGQAVMQVASGGAFDGLLGAVSAAAPALQGLAPLIGDLLVSAVETLASLLGPLAGLIAAIIPPVASLASAVLPVLGPLLEALGAAIGGIVTALTPVIAKILEIVSAIVGPLIAAIAPVITEHLPQFQAAIARLAEAFMPLLNMIKTVVDFLVPYLIPAIKMFADTLLDNLIVAINLVVDIFTAAVKLIQGVWDIFAGVFQGDWSRVWTGIKEVFGAVWGAIEAILVAVFDVIKNTVANSTAQARQAWSDAWHAVQDTAATVWNWLRSTWSSVTAAITSTATAAWSNIRSTFSGLWNTITNLASAAWTTLRSIFANGVADAENTVRELPSRARAALGNLSSILVNAGIQLIAGFIDGITSMFGAVERRLGDLTSSLTAWKGPESLDRVLLVNAGQLVIDGFIRGLESRYGAVRKSLSGLTADIGSMTVSPPQVRAFDASALAANVSSALAAETSAGGVTKVLNYYAAPGSSLGSEEDLFAATGRARMVGW
ncbi:hypothetical protein [Actinoplanes sp. NPDC049118]|uniref:phage tail protein n=1 Tax=Actinoplanes sp. NPDC049118 TaxID=3155769 RepID=UPI0033D7EAA9